jgi:hypothetical protein
MATKCAGNNGEAGASEKLRRSKRNKDHVEEDVDSAIESIDNGGIMVKPVRKLRSP